MNTTTIATMIQMLRERNVEPDESFTAAAGHDYGFVAAYQMPKGDYMVSYGNNGQTDYAIADNADDLACWLLPGGDDGCDGSEDAAIIVASIRGITEVTAAAETDEGPFRVIVTREYYGPTAVSDWSGDGNRTFEFDTYVEAQAWIDERDNEVYTTTHNEIGRPTYTIVNT
jgi:hypothetical protein